MIKLARFGRRAGLPVAAVVLTFAAFGIAASTPAGLRPAWAFPTPAKTAAPPPGAVRLPGTDVWFAPAVINEFFRAADWRTGDHPPAPDIVMHGRRPDVFACGLCHLADGQGKPENASLAGLSQAYIVQQIGEFRAGRRRYPVSGLLTEGAMNHVAANVRPAELDAAARYYSRLAYRPWIEVVETRVVPRTRVTVADSYEPIAGGGTELLGQRIIEVPRWSVKRSSNDHPIGFTAYVPVRAIGRGQALASRNPTACATCHGARLEGGPEAPRLAGRSPTYLARQLIDMRAGTRRGLAVAPMTSVTARLSDADIIDLTAYLASRRP